ncbi:MAG: NADH-quinone oxidoreductase subunit J [Candidatus Adiutrix sp.]|jgi:NADH-quinone oxidoreductase subunit J|nr:NADH-quinone oxidoreductase subunit J [Candidatus Adiutrix sp.]
MPDLTAAAGAVFAGAGALDAFLQGFADMKLPGLGEDIMAYLAYILYLAMMAGGGLAAVLAGNLVRALLGLAAAFMGAAGMYLLMASPFMAFMQLLIYIGAICVLIFFAIMLVQNASGGEETRRPGLGQLFYGLAAAGAAVLLFGPVIVRHAGRLARAARPSETPTADLGQGLLSYYVVPFELISMILLAAMAGGVFLIWEKRRKR